MSMFDDIKCLYTLPKPEDLKGLSEEYFNSNSNFQTNDLDNFLESYEIRSDGTLWKKEDHEDIWNALLDFTGDIKFCDYYNSESENDYWIEYKALFNEGKLISLKLINFEATNNKSRKDSIALWHENVQERNKLWDKWYIKHIYKYYDKFIAFIFRLWYNKNRYANKLPSAHDIERWLRPL